MRTTPLPSRYLSSSRLWTAVLFVSAVTVYFVVLGHRYLEAWQFPDALIAPIMALGSFVAGSTFLGGGAVAFPALTKLLQVDPASARTFSLAIQSVGMTSAALYILLRIQSLPWRFFAFYLPSSIAGLFCSLAVFDQWVEPTDLRVCFSLFLLVFLVVYLWAYSNKDTHYRDIPQYSRMDLQLIVKAGFIGGSISGLLGSGADLVAFCLLALYFRLDLKLATQVSVIVMAANSIVGVAFQGLVFGEMSDQVMTLWLLAAPVVMIGAPVGAVFCRRVTTRSLLIFISLIVAVELTTTLLLVPIELARLPLYLGIALISLGLLIVLQKISRRKSHSGQHPFMPGTVTDPSGADTVMKQPEN